MLAGQGALDAELAQILRTTSLEMPGSLRAFLEGGKSPQQALPMVLGGDGLLRVSDDTDALGDWRTQSPESIWAAGGETIERVRASIRPFDEVELLPETLVSLR